MHFRFIAVTDSGQVYAWGDNDHGQQGNGTTMVNRKPALVHGLEGYKVSRVACGSSHSVCWTSQDTPSASCHEPVSSHTVIQFETLWNLHFLCINSRFYSRNQKILLAQVSSQITQMLKVIQITQLPPITEFQPQCSLLPIR